MNGDGDLELWAALLRRGRDIPEMVANLAARLEQALPQHVEVRRRALGRKVREVRIDLTPYAFRIELHGHRVLALVDHVVRGVCVRSEEVVFDDWIERLASALSAEATRNTEVRLALEDALR